MSAKLSQHPLSTAFPAMQADEYQALVDSIGNIGVQNPITLFEGMVIDGWHRYTAATESGMTCPTAELGDVDPRDFVLAQNKARRNLSASQRAAAVTSVYQWAPAHREKKVEVTSTLSKTNSELAAIAGVSTKTIQQAKVAHKAGLTDAVKAGAITVEEASKIATGKPVKVAVKPVKPAPVQPEDADYSGPDEAEMASILADEKQNLAKVLEIMDSGDALGDALKENERLRMELATVKSQRDGFMNQCAELIRRVKSLRRTNDKLQGK